MNICTPGNCLCDTREWEGDTDCFGNTEEDDRRMSYDFDSGYYDDGIEEALDRDHDAGVKANAERIEEQRRQERVRNKDARSLLMEWDWHNRKHDCYYEQSDDAGIAECPSRFKTMRDFFESRGFDIPKGANRIHGRNLSEPNFWSGISGPENPVADSSHDIRVNLDGEKPLSIAELRKKGDRKANRGIHYRDQTTTVLSTRAEKAKKVPSENDEPVWQVEAMEYFKERLDTLDAMAQNIRVNLHNVLQTVDDLSDRVDALAESVAEAKPKPTKPQITITLDTSNFDETVGIAEQLSGELEKRVERLVRQRAGRNNASPQT